MPSQHRDPALTIRPPENVQKQAKTVLKAHEWGVKEFVTACLVGVAVAPDDFLERLEPHRPHPEQ